MTTTPDDAQKAYETNQRAAERAHDGEVAFFQAVNEAAIRSGENAIKAAILINGGACVAIMAFVGALASQGRIGTAQLTDVASCMVDFASGVAFGGAAAGASYLTNYCIAGLSASRTRHWDHPYVRPGQNFPRWRTTARIFQILAIGFALGSLVAFIFGVVQLRKSVARLDPIAINTPNR
jgi:hypothetical protein